MTRQPHQFPSGDEPADAGLDLPPRLLADLRAAHRSPVIPPAMDAAVRRHARASFARRRRVNPWIRWGAVAVAAAAMVVVAVRLVVSPGDPGAVADHGAPVEHSTGGSAPAAARPASPAAAPQPVPAFAATDVNHDGLVDVLDALTVARGVKAGRPAAAWDVTGDGRVDQQDVDAIAIQAVSVTRQVSSARQASPNRRVSMGGPVGPDLASRAAGHGGGVQ